MAYVLFGRMLSGGGALLAISAQSVETFIAGLVVMSAGLVVCGGEARMQE